VDLSRSRRAFLAALLSLAATAFGTAACGGGGGGDDDGQDGPDDPMGPDDPGEGSVVTLRSGLRFDPSDLTVSPGTTVRWVNEASITHTVTPDGHTEWQEWATGSQGQTFEHTFASAGTFPYYCEPHRGDGMTGVIRVQ
jgi:plastocyanin